MRRTALCALLLIGAPVAANAEGWSTVVRPAPQPVAPERLALTPSGPAQPAAPLERRVDRVLERGRVRVGFEDRFGAAPADPHRDERHVRARRFFDETDGVAPYVGGGLGATNDGVAASFLGGLEAPLRDRRAAVYGEYHQLRGGGDGPDHRLAIGVRRAF